MIIIAALVLMLGLLFFCLFVGMPYAEKRYRWHYEQMMKIMEKEP